jgi:NADH-quinone oxidoreductase subunit K
MNMEIPMIYYLVVSTIMFFAGVYGFITRKNMLAMLISLELMLNAVDINFVVFNRYLYPEALEGHFFTLFAIGIAAAETALAIAIILNIFRNIQNVEVKNLDKMKF